MTATAGIPTEAITALNGAVADVAGQVTGLVVSNLPIVLGVTAAFLGLGIAKRFVRSLGH